MQIGRNRKKPVFSYYASQSGLFDFAAVRHLVSLGRRGVADVAYPMFGLLCIELWCRMFVDREVLSPS